MNNVKIPDGLEYWPCVDIAECLPYQNYLPGKHAREALYGKLWGILAEADNATPLGGDGSDGTVEEPSGRLDLDNDDKAGHWWHKLTDAEANAIVQAYAARKNIWWGKPS